MAIAGAAGPRSRWSACSSSSSSILKPTGSHHFRGQANRLVLLRRTRPPRWLVMPLRRFDHAMGRGRITVRHTGGRAARPITHRIGQGRAARQRRSRQSSREEAIRAAAEALLMLQTRPRHGWHRRGGIPDREAGALRCGGWDDEQARPPDLASGGPPDEHFHVPPEQCIRTRRSTRARESRATADRRAEYDTGIVMMAENRATLRKIRDLRCMPSAGPASWMSTDAAKVRRSLRRHAGYSFSRDVAGKSSERVPSRPGLDLHAR
jgi:hypothetical protein